MVWICMLCNCRSSLSFVALCAHESSCKRTPVPSRETNQSFTNDAAYDCPRRTNKELPKPNTKSLSPKKSETLHEQKWQKMFHDLVEYRKQHGDFHVPKKSKKLWSWVAHQRSQYLFMKEGKKSSMTKERADQLDAVEFVWSGPHSNTWKRMFEKLVRYKEQHGHCCAPYKKGADKQLRQWVHKQRHKYKKMKMGEKGSLTTERFEMLDSIGFTWEYSTQKRR